MKKIRVRPSKFPYFLSWNIERHTVGGAASSYFTPLSPGRFLQSEIIELKRFLRKISRAQWLMSDHRNLTMKYHYKVLTEISFDKNTCHFTFNSIKVHCIVLVWHSDDRIRFSAENFDLKSFKIFVFMITSNVLIHSHVK